MPQAQEEKRLDEIIGDLHRPVLSRQPTQQKYDYLAQEVRKGAMPLIKALHCIHRYTAPTDEKFVEPAHQRSPSP